MIEPTIFPALSKALHDRLTNQAMSHDTKGQTAFRTLAVISTRPKTFKVTVFPQKSGNRSEAEFGIN